MKKCMLLFILLSAHLMMGQVNLIENPGFESGIISTTIDQVDHATGWSNGCRRQNLAVDYCTPDLYDKNGYQSCFVEKTLLPRDNDFVNNRYVHMFNGDTEPTTGESVKATITEALSDSFTYRVSCYVSRMKYSYEEEPPVQLEFVLRNNDNCDVEKIVYTSTYVEPVFSYTPCEDITEEPSTDWREKFGSFNLDAGDISEGYNRLEIRIKGHGNILSPVFIDDVELTKVAPVKACFEIKNIYKERVEQSDYGQQIVKQLCLPKVEIDGSCSTNEDGYYIRISEFSFSPWAIVADYYDGWVNTGEAPSNISLTSLIGVPSANNGWTSRTFDPAKLYSVNLSVGPIWDAAPLQFFRVQNCQGNTACFEIKNVDSTYTAPSDYGPKTVNELCLPKIEIDGSCSTNEEGYHIRISEFSLSPWAIITDYYDGWVGPGTAPSNIDLTSLIGVPSANNGWTSRIFDPSKLYAVNLSVGPIWESAPFQFFKVKDCREIEACFEIKNVDSTYTAPSDYGPKTVNELCLPKIEIDGSCSTDEEGYHIRISEFSFSPWAIITDYYDGWVGPGTAPSNINLTSLIGVPSANNGWTSRTFDPSKLYAVSLSVGPVWDSAPFQFFKVKDCREIEACFEIKNIHSEANEPSDYGPKSVKQLCLPKIEIDGSCSMNEEGYHIRVSEFSLSPWAIITDYYDGWVGTGTAPSNINLTSLIGVPSANNGWTSRTFDPSKLYAVSLSVGPVWDSAPFQFFRVLDCRRNGSNTTMNTETTLVDMYPNPAKDYVNVTFTKNETGNIEIYRFDGTLIYSEKFNDTSNFIFNMSTYDKGLYLVRVHLGQKTETHKIYKE